MTIKAEAAKEILEDVCEEFIPGEYEVGFTEDDKGKPLVYVSTKDGDAYAWHLNEPSLSETLLFLDAHTFCAWVIRQAGRSEKAQVRVRVLPSRKLLSQKR